MKICDLDYFNQITQESGFFGGRYYGGAFKLRRLATKFFGRVPSIKFLTQAGINLRNGSSLTISPLISVGANSTGSTLTATVESSDDGIQKASFSSSSSSG